MRPDGEQNLDRSPFTPEITSRLDIYYDSDSGKLIDNRPNTAIGQATVGLTADTEPLVNSLERRERKSPVEAIAELSKRVPAMRAFVIEADGIPQVTESGRRLTLRELNALNVNKSLPDEFDIPRAA